MAQPKLCSGYAFRSSRRHPKEPEVAVVTPGAHPKKANYVGTAVIDGAPMNAFRAKIGGKIRYFFQSKQGC